MKSMICVAVVATLAIAIRLATAAGEGAENGKGKIQVSVDDLGKTAELIGRLGKPLGTWVTIKGTWALPKSTAKPSGFKFTVTHVSNTKLERPIEFDVALLKVVDRRGNDVTPKFENRNMFDGRTWTLKGYETGRFHIEPAEYDAAIGAQASQRPYWIRPFTSEIVGVLQP